MPLLCGSQRGEGEAGDPGRRLGSWSTWGEGQTGTLLVKRFLVGSPEDHQLVGQQTLVQYTRGMGVEYSEHITVVSD